MVSDIQKFKIPPSKKFFKDSFQLNLNKIPMILEENHGKAILAKGLIPVTPQDSFSNFFQPFLVEKRH